MEQLSDNRKKIREAFRSGQINAICGYPGIGKTYLTHQHPQFIDGFFSKQYYLDKKNGIVNPDFPDNYRRFCVEAVLFGKIVVCAMHPKAREVFDSLGMSYLMIYPNPNERERYFNIYGTRPDEREWIELNKSTWDTKIQSLKDAKIPTNCHKDEIPTGMNLTEYLEWLGIFEGVEPLPNIFRILDSIPMKPETPWYDAQTACETAIRQQFRGGVSVPFWDNFCDSPAFYATARPDVVKEYYKKVIKNQWYEVKMV